MGVLVGGGGRGPGRLVSERSLFSWREVELRPAQRAGAEHERVPVSVMADDPRAE